MASESPGDNVGVAVVLEFSRPVALSRIKTVPSTHKIEATAEECSALAKRFSLFALERLYATVTLYRQNDDIRLEAELDADLMQSAAPGVEPLSENVTDRFVLIYRSGIDEEEADRLTIEEPGDEVIEPLSSTEIDIGEAVAQQLSLAMEPFPSFGDIELDDGDDGGPVDALRQGNPFSILWSLKKNESSNS